MNIIRIRLTDGEVVDYRASEEVVSKTFEDVANGKWIAFSTPRNSKVIYNPRNIVSIEAGENLKTKISLDESVGNDDGTI